MDTRRKDPLSCIIRHWMLHNRFAMNMIPISTYQEFKSAFTRPEQRRAFLLDCARRGFESIRATWPNADSRLFVFGSAAKRPINIGSDSDLDVAVVGLNHIAEKSWQRNALLLETFKRGLSQENQTLPVDVVTIDIDNPETVIASEVIKNGIEIKVE